MYSVFGAGSGAVCNLMLMMIFQFGSAGFLLKNYVEIEGPEI
jgi:hypothetical protein